MMHTDSVALLVGYARAPKELRRRQRQPLPEPGKWLRSHALVTLRLHIANLWPGALRKRCPKHRTTWDWITKIVDDGPFVV